MGIYEELEQKLNGRLIIRDAPFLSLRATTCIGDVAQGVEPRKGGEIDYRQPMRGERIV